MYKTEHRKSLALDIVYDINPDAQLTGTTNEFGKKLYNNLSLDDCRARCAAVDKEFAQDGNEEAAKVVHEIPLFVFAMLSKEEIKEFVFVWMAKGIIRG